jgi:hypothetical protein
MNLCGSCGEDFSSVAAFDKHRTGTHAYTFAEGLAFDIPREDGRRCMDGAEMADAGMEVDGRGRWRIAADVERVARWFAQQAA